MKRIKAFALLLGVVVLASCASQKRVIYLQDTQADEQIKIAQDYQIRIKPLDRLTVVVNSRTRNWLRRSIHRPLSTP